MNLYEPGMDVRYFAAMTDRSIDYTPSDNEECARALVRLLWKYEVLEKFTLQEHHYSMEVAYAILGLREQHVPWGQALKYVLNRTETIGVEK